MGLITCQHSTSIDGFIAEAHGRSDRLRAWLRAESATDVAGLAGFADPKPPEPPLPAPPRHHSSAIRLCHDTHLKCTKHPGWARRNAPTGTLDHLLHPGPVPDRAGPLIVGNPAGRGTRGAAHPDPPYRQQQAPRLLPDTGAEYGRRCEHRYSRSSAHSPRSSGNRRSARRCWRACGAPRRARTDAWRLGAVWPGALGEGADR